MVSCAEPTPGPTAEWALGHGYRAQTEPKFHVVAYDFGVKHNILRMLAERGCKGDGGAGANPAAEVLALNPDGVFLSNGPGDPEPCDYAIAAIRQVLDTRLPVFGICLGHQLLGWPLAPNQQDEVWPSRRQPSGAGSGQRPGDDHQPEPRFPVDETSLPANVRVTHRSLFDHTVQGIALTDRPAFSFRGPEASPGPNDVGLSV